MNNLYKKRGIYIFAFTIFLLLFLCTPVSVQGQTSEASKKISGIITDANGNPIPGAVVSLIGSTIGTISNEDGAFSLSAPVGAKMTVNIVGYVTTSFTVDNRDVYNISMTEEVVTLDDVVVVGYGTQKKENLTGAVAVVTADDLKDRPVSNLSQALQGVVPNLQVSFSSGAPGSGASFELRGTGSPNGGSPLILVDGVETYAERINPNDIERISVLKDAASAAIYGVKAAFGVILITTKKGSREQAAKVNYEAYFALSAPTTSTDYETRGYYSASIADFFMMSGRGIPYTKYTAADYDAMWARRNDKTEHPDRPWVITDTRNGRDTYVYLANFDWNKYLYDMRRPTQEHNVSVTGGSKNTSYMISGRYYSQDGIQKLGDDNYKSFNTRVNLSVDVYKWLEVRSSTKMFNGVYTYDGLESETTNFRRPQMHNLASFVPTNPDGTAVAYTSMTNAATHFPSDGWVAMMQKRKSGGHKKTSELSSKIEAIFKLTPDLTFTADGAFKKGYLRNDFRSVEVQYSQYPGEIGTLSTSNYPDNYKEVVYDQMYYNANAFANYKKTWKENHNFEAIVGFNYESNAYKDLTVSRQNLLTEDLSDFNLATGESFEIKGGYREFNSLGWFYRFTYNYKGIYLFETNARYDGASKFPRGDRFGFFPSFSAGYRISEEPYFKSLTNQIDNLKLRLSYGSLGNHAIDPYYFLQNINKKTSSSYTFDGATLPGIATADDPVGQTLTWEKVVHKNLGIDAAFLRSRLTLTADAYIRDVIGFIDEGSTLPAVYGAASPKINANDLRNKGWEISIGWRDKFTLANKPFRYSVTAMLSDYTAKYTKVDNPTGNLSDKRVGQRVGEIWGYRVDGLFATTAEAQEYASRIDLTEVAWDYFRPDAGTYGNGIQAGDMKFLDLNGDNKVNGGTNTVDNPGDREIIGNSLPRYTYALNLSVDWQGFDLAVFFQGVGHQDWYAGNDNIKFWGPYVRPFASFQLRNFMSNVWSEDNPDGYFPRARAYSARDSKHSMYNVNDRYLQNIAYCRLKNLAVGYTLPDKVISKIGINRCRVYFSGENLFYFSPLKSDLVDPEEAAASKNTDSYPWYKTFAIGLNITF